MYRNNLDLHMFNQKFYSLHLITFCAGDLIGYVSCKLPVCIFLGTVLKLSVFDYFKVIFGTPKYVIFNTDKY